MTVLDILTESPQAAPFRALLPPEGHPKLTALKSSTAREWYESKRDLPELQAFLQKLELKSLSRPYKGFTSNGKVIEGVFQYDAAEGAPIGEMVEKPTNFLDLLSPKQRKSTLFPSVEQDEIRMWSNPDFYVNPGKKILPRVPRHD